MVVVEVKNPLYSLVKNAKEDINRIIAMLDKNKNKNSFKFGILAFHSSASDKGGKSSENVLGGDISTMKKTANALYGTRVRLVQGKITTIEHSSKCSACFVIT